jgi:hypothetical protein
METTNIDSHVDNADTKASDLASEPLGQRARGKDERRADRMPGIAGGRASEPGDVWRS